jgi:aminopeptidase YwaD
VKINMCRGVFSGLVMLLAPCDVQSQSQSTSTPAAFVPITQSVAGELSGKKALSTVAYVEQFFRLPGNRGFDAALDTVAALLEQAGFVQESQANATNRLVYRMESRPMRAAAWSPDSASLTLGGRGAPLLRWATNHNMLAINSESTPPGGVNAELVDVRDGADSVFLKTDVKGKIVFTTGAARTVFPRAMQRGALGVLATQNLPAYNKTSQNVHSIGFSSIPRDTVTKGWLIFLSTAARDSVRAFLASIPRPRVHVAVAARFENRPERTLVAEVRGRSAPNERFVYSAHVQEPGANDNASGVGLLAEMARVTAQLLQQRRVDPARTITFLWGDEISSTRRFLQEDSARRVGVKWGMSLDMVGENTALTGGTFLIEKMPDPSAVWVRGEDQHSEWGGRPIPESAIRPHFFNDFVRRRCLDRAAATQWVVKSNPFEGGSDHTPFLDANIPGLLLWHFTDQYYHTDRDRIEMVSDSTLANVGNCALTTSLLLTTGGTTIATAALDELAEVAIRALATQAGLARDTLSRGGQRAHEQHILGTWRDYYIAALARVADIGPIDQRRLASAQDRIRTTAADLIAGLR